MLAKVNTLMYGYLMERLSREDWLKHGLKTLALSGHTALKAEPLAKALGVSRGSFYWHFADLSAFHGALLDFWRAVATEAVIDEIEAAKARSARLGDLMQRAFFADSKVDRAIRHWSSYSPDVRSAVGKVDRLRIDYLKKLIAEGGLSEVEANRRAKFIYAASLGVAQIADPTGATFNRPDLSALADHMKKG